jgi:glycosyltransferase involved in cell wall biosynthesis
MTKVLVCSEFSQIGSGYAAYTKELLAGFLKHGIEFAELASYCRPDDVRIQNCRWRVYPVMPHTQDAEGWNVYNSHPANAFGKHVFENVLLDYKPTHVIDVRDVWNLTHELISPFRDFYSYCIMPAIDSDPQSKNWLDMYCKANAVVTYCDWATNLLHRYGLKNVVGAASPVAAEEYKPLPDKDKLKGSLGLGDIKIIGTVMRNQPRKLFPHLFKMFRKYIETSGRDDVYLYCHTSYPDVWELDELLIENNIGHKVIFTYYCPACNYIETSFYKGPFASCTHCKQRNTLKLPTTYQPISQYSLNQVYNLFDLYIQYAALEGYGIPLAEAAAAGIPSMCVDYSAMETFIKESNTVPIKVKNYHIEPETGRRFALPDEDDAVSKITELLSLPKSELEQRGKMSRFMYGVRGTDDIVDTWVKAISGTQPRLSWDTPKRQYKNPQDYPKNLAHELFAKWLIVDVLQDPSYIGSYMEARLVRDLENGFALVGHDNKYFYEALNIPSQRFQPFSQEVAFNHFRNLLQEKLVWEDKRISV